MKKPHHYYKVAADSATGQQIKQFIRSCDDVAERARQWAMSHGVSFYYESPEGMSGGIAAVEFDDGLEHVGWDKLTSADGTVYYMPAPGTDIEHDMYNLPIVEASALIPILHFVPVEDKDGKPCPFIFGNETPILFRFEADWYVDVPYECEADELVLLNKKTFVAALTAARNLDNAKKGK